VENDKENVHDDIDMTDIVFSPVWPGVCFEFALLHVYLEKRTNTHTGEKSKLRNVN